MALKPASTSPVSRSKATPKTKKNSLAVLQCSLQNKWEVVYAGLSKISYVSTILDQKRQKYPINSSLQNRKTAAKKNIKTLSATVQNIQALLNDGSAAIEAADSIDTAFDLLCFVSHQIVMFESLLAKLKALYGYTYQSDSKISELKDESFTHYKALLRKTLETEFSAKKKLVTQKEQLTIETQSLAQQHSIITADVENCQAALAHATLTLEKSIQRQKTIQEISQSQQLLIEREISSLEETLTQVNNSIVAVKDSVATNVAAHADAMAQKGALMTELQASLRDRDRLFAQGQSKTSTLQYQIAEAEAIVRKSLFFKNSKIQRVEELKWSLSNHKENMQQQKMQLENTLATLQKSYATQTDQTEKFASIVAENREALAHLTQEKSDLQQKIEDKQVAFQKLEGRIDAATATVIKEEETLREKEKELEALRTTLDDCAKTLECNQRKEAAFDSEITEKIQIYPSNFSHLEDSIVSNAISEYAFSQQISDAFNAATKSLAQIAMLENQRSHLQALQQVFVELSENGTIAPENVDLSLCSKLNGIDEKLRLLAEDTAAFQTAFDPVDNVASRRRSSAIVREAKKLFAACWALISDDALLPQELQVALDGTRCLQVSDNCYLCLTPFYIVALELKNSFKIGIVEYTAISMESVAPQIVLDYGQACPNAATIISERWEHETVNGAPDRRYTNNRSYYVVALNGVKLVYNGKSKITYFESAEDVKRITQAFHDYKNFLYNENADVMDRIFASNQIPNVALIATEIAESRKKEQALEKEREHQRQQQELMLRKQREDEKRKKELHQKHLELWANNARKKKEEDDLLVSLRPDLLSPITASQLANWDMQQSMPVTISDKRRVITTGITKVEFVQKENASNTEKYLVFFADETGKEFSDVRTLACSPIGTTDIIPFEIKTQSTSNPAVLYLLVRNMEDGKLVGKFEYKMNIAFANDFDF